MKKKINNLSLIFFLIFIIFTYIYGFLIKEDSSGGGKIDFTLHIYNNFELFYWIDFFDINWNSYDSTSLPLHYIISKLLIKSQDPDIYKLFWFLFSFIGFLFFYLLLSKKLNTKKKIDLKLTFLASTILLSPYFRTSAFWGLEENIGVVLLTITLYFYLSYKENKNTIFFILTIFFASLTLYSRQSYLFLQITIFILLLDYHEIFKKKNFYLILLFTIFLLPMLYFFLVWNGFSPPNAQIDRFDQFRYNNIPTILNIYLIYLIPFFLKYICFNKIKFDLKNFILFIVLFLIYVTFFNEYHWTSNGSGILPKILNLFSFQDHVAKYILLISSFISLYIIVIVSNNSIALYLYFFINLILFCLIDVVFQEYFDPICIIILLCFSQKAFLDDKKIDLKIIIPMYSGVILLGSIIYH